MSNAKATEMPVSPDDQTAFLERLAEDLNSRNIRLPSFPDVVINIRAALEDPKCTSERLAAVVRTDAILVAKLLIAANSAYHNRAGIEITDLNLAISRLGFEVVRNTAITLAVEQIFNAAEHEELRDAIKAIWQRSLSLASMSFVIARQTASVNADNAFLSGLFHEIGKLYILTQAREFPALMGDSDTLDSVLRDWTPSVGASVVESWGFDADIARSLDVEENLQLTHNAPATLVDVIYAARELLDRDEDSAAPIGDEIAGKLSISDDSLLLIRESHELHAQSLRQSAGA